MPRKLLLLSLISTLLISCSDDSPNTDSGSTSSKASDNKIIVSQNDINNTPKVSEVYAEFVLTSDLSHLSNNQKKLIPILIKVSQIMDELFWLQAYGDKDELLNAIKDPNLKSLVDINYGPWDRLNGDKKLIGSFSEKPPGANFYPKDMTKQEFESSNDAEKTNLYTVLERDKSGSLISIPYHTKYKKRLEKASDLLRQAAYLADDEGFKKYLELRSEALLTDKFHESDIAWMDMKSNDIDFVVGPIENYEDQLYNYKTAYESYVLVKDKEWSDKLAKFARLLPALQKGLPVKDEYKTESPGTDSDLNAYDALYYAGHSNAGSKTIAINLPNDESVQLEKGSRRLQLKNAMRAKFEKILIPISNKLVAPEQRKHITFNAFFSNTMFHEVAHGLGIKNTINNKGTVREALKQYASAQEEGKADILGLFMVEKLYQMGLLSEGEIMDNYVTFMAGIFRSVRFGTSSAHGVANMLRFNFFAQHEAFNFDKSTGYYSVNPKKMSHAIQLLSNKILTLQGDGDYEGVELWVKEQGNVSPELKAALDRLSDIPVDIVFKQGVEYLDL